jgi:hypothetical protein
MVFGAGAITQEAVLSKPHRPATSVRFFVCEPGKRKDLIDV